MYTEKRGNIDVRGNSDRFKISNEKYSLGFEQMLKSFETKLTLIRKTMLNSIIFIP